MTENLKVAVDPSYCYDGSDENCRRYGRLYTWESAQRACHALGDGWRLPTNDEWAHMAKPYGGVRDDSADGGKAAYVALITGGPSGFDAIYGGGRDPSGEYARLEAHGFYWTATESSPTKAWFYNLGKNGQILNRHEDGEKHSALRAAQRAPDRLTRVQQWAIATACHRGRNKATIALANTLARIVWAVWRHDDTFHARPPLTAAT